MGPKSYQIICGTKYRYWTRSWGPTGPKTSSIIYCTNEAIKKWKYAMKNKQSWLLETKCQQKIWLNLRQQIGQNTTHSGYGPKSWKLWLWFEGCECENPEKNTDNVIKSHKCNQCNYTSAQACHLRHHLKTHSGEKPNKCNQCDYASSQKSTLRRHLLTHSGKNQTNATNATIHLLMQAFWGDTWKRTVEKRQTNAINATMPLLKQAIWGDICKRTAEKNQTTAINATMHLYR